MKHLTAVGIAHGKSAEEPERSAATWGHRGGDMATNQKTLQGAESCWKAGEGWEQFCGYFSPVSERAVWLHMHSLGVTGPDYLFHTGLP